MKTERVYIDYKGECVGLAARVSVDMWHMRGDWACRQVPLRNEFEQCVEPLTQESVLRDYRRGVVVRCRPESGRAHLAVVTGLRDGVLGFMRFSSGEALKWAEETYASVCVE